MNFHVMENIEMVRLPFLSRLTSIAMARLKEWHLRIPFQSFQSLLGPVAAIGHW